MLSIFVPSTQGNTPDSTGNRPKISGRLQNLVNYHLHQFKIEQKLLEGGSKNRLAAIFLGFTLCRDQRV